MTSSLHRILRSALLAVSLAGIAAAPAAAQFGINVHLGPQPPPHREYVGRAPRPGCFFRRGHYVARGNHWFWVRGRWICR